MLVSSASSVSASPAMLRRQANQHQGRRKKGRIHQLHSLWCRAQAQAAISSTVPNRPAYSSTSGQPMKMPTSPGMPPG